MEERNNGFMNMPEGDEKEYREITLKFGKGCVGDTFEGKDGNTYTQIKIPNPDKDDHRPWQTFVVKENHLHENRFGKGMWIKLPEEGHTTLHRNVKVGKDDQGNTLWDVEKTKVTNKELKKLVESYKDKDRDNERGSMKDMLAEKKMEADMQKSAARPRNRAAEMAL